MAYTHSKYEVYLMGAAGTSANLNLAGAVADKFYWSPGYVPHYIRACSVIITTATVGTSANVDFDKRVTAGSDTGRVSNGGVARVIVPAKAAGIVMYKDGLNALITPGQEVVLKLQTAMGTSGVATCVMYVEPTWELPGNNSSMVATA